MGKTKGTGQGRLRRTWNHKRAHRRGAGAGGALEGRVHRAVAATVASPSVSVQDPRLHHSSLNLCRVSRGGFGTEALGGIARMNWSGGSRGGVTSDH